MLILKTTLQLFRVLPLRVVHALGGVAGWLMSVFPTAAREVTRVNLALCFPELGEAERSSLVRSSLRETARTAFELGRIWLAPVGNVRPLVQEVSGEVHIRRALAAGKGVIILAPHLGSWELFGLHLTAYAPLTALYKPPKLAGLEADMNHFRTRGGAKTAPTNKKGVMQLLRALQQGEMVGILPDQQPDNSSGGVFAPFFGVEALTMTLVAKLAAKTGAAVICGYARRLPAGRGFEVVFRPAEPGVDSEDPVQAATALNRSVEQCVRENIAQYQWEYKRFNRRPEGDPARVYPPTGRGRRRKKGRA